MKATELINMLEILINKIGDKNVELWNFDGEWDIEKVRFVSRHNVIILDIKDKNK